MSSFYPGQHVVCVDPVGILVKNKVYTVRECGHWDEKVSFNKMTGVVVKVDKITPEYVLWLHEARVNRVAGVGPPLQPPYNDLPFRADRFRPLRRLTTEEFTGELTPVDVREMTETY